MGKHPHLWEGVIEQMDWNQDCQTDKYVKIRWEEGEIGLTEAIWERLRIEEHLRSVIKT